jgi:hypothetical protein
MHRVISLLFLALAAAFSGCGPSFHYEPPFTVTDRHPFNAVVWLFKDESPESPAFATDSPDGGDQVFNSSLTRDGSAWRPRLSMEKLRAALRRAFDDAGDRMGQELDEERHDDTLLQGDSKAAGETPAADSQTAGG